MSKSYYLITKPLQYFNATNIDDENPERICLMVDVFYNAAEFFKNVERHAYWNQVLFFTTSSDAYKWLENKVLKNDNLYIDSDYGLKKTIWLSRIKTGNIFVYEEGTGSYIDDFFELGRTNNKVFILFLKALGITGYMGGGRYTKGIVLYDTEKHRQLIPQYRKARHTFKRKFIQHMPFVEDHFSHQMAKNTQVLDEITEKKILLYLSSWEYNTKVGHLMSQYPDHLKIIKLHPHIRDTHTPDDFDYILSNDLFAEMFIMKAVNVSSEVVVIHENSSAMLYLNSDKIKSVILS